MIFVVPTTKSPLIVVSVFIFTSALNIVGCSVMVVFVIVGSSLSNGICDMLSPVEDPNVYD